MKIGVVADDVTGANDIGIMFAKSDYLTHVYSILPAGDYAFTAETPQPNVCILDTNSRLDTPAVAYQKATGATRLLQTAGCRQFFNKTCSVFRGNVGVEFDAMLDVLGEEFAVVVLGFPKNGRITRNTIHYVHAVPLAESEFRNDPIHPMTQSNLVNILQAQTERKVAALGHTTIEQGPAALRQCVQAMRDSCNYLILDVVDQAALRTIAAAVHDFPVLCGSSALAEELPSVWGPPEPVADSPEIPPRNGLGVLCVAGSLMPQTRAQVEHLRQAGTAAFSLSPEALAGGTTAQAEIGQVVAALARTLEAEEDAIFHSPYELQQVERTRVLGMARGLGQTAVARLVSDTIAGVVAQIVEQVGLNRLVVAGGETSAAVCSRLGISGMQIWQEIQPGLPSCLTLTRPPLFLVLKSGSFGSAAFLEEAIAHLKNQYSERTHRKRSVPQETSEVLPLETLFHSTKKTSEV
jgi:uncharacterized protein YgbK (DUF1537 family)